MWWCFLWIAPKKAGYMALVHMFVILIILLAMLGIFQVQQLHVLVMKLPRLLFKSLFLVVKVSIVAGWNLTVMSFILLYLPFSGFIPHSDILRSQFVSERWHLEWAAGSRNSSVSAARCRPWLRDLSRRIVVHRSRLDNPAQCQDMPVKPWFNMVQPYVQPYVQPRFNHMLNHGETMEKTRVKPWFNPSKKTSRPAQTQGSTVRLFGLELATQAFLQQSRGIT